mgnify:CR=1 FL=1
MNLNKKHTTLIQDFLESKKEISNSTRTTYKNSFIRLINLIYPTNKRKYLFTQSQPEIFALIDASTYPINTKIEALKMYKYLTDYKNKPSLLIDNKIAGYFQKLNDVRATTNKKTISNLTYPQLLDMLEQSTGQKYLILYLLINGNVRNMDLIIEYTDDSKLINNVIGGNTKKNIIFLKNGSAFFVRSDYKTADKYGIKKMTIENQKFIDIIRDFPKNEMIFKNRGGKPYKTNEMSNYIKSIGRKFNPKLNLNQQMIYKIILNHHENNNDYKKMTELSKNRGHSLDIQKTFYSSK